MKKKVLKKRKIVILRLNLALFISHLNKNGRITLLFLPECMFAEKEPTYMCVPMSAPGLYTFCQPAADILKETAP